MRSLFWIRSGRKSRQLTGADDNSSIDAVSDCRNLAFRVTKKWGQRLITLAPTIVTE